MGMRSAGSARGGGAPMLRVATAAQAAEAAGLCVAIILNVIDSASGNDWTSSNATALIVLALIVALVVDGEPFAQLSQRPGEQPGHVHLGDAELGGDLRLGHVPEEPQQQDLLLARREPLEQRLQGLAVLHALEGFVDHAERVGDRG